MCDRLSNTTCNLKAYQCLLFDPLTSTDSTQVETRSEAAATNGGVTATKEGEKSSPKSRDSLDRKASPPSEEDKGREDRARTLSARSFDPLPAIPNLDTVEDGRQRSKNSPPVAGGGRGMDDDDDEAGYAYARVGGAAVAMADSDKEDKSDSASSGRNSGLPPYGKVSHHVTKAKVTETEEYAEVKEVFRGPLATVATSRSRSATDPIDPAEAGADSLREKRVLTHTHMMPLPAVPRPQENIDDSEMYDSIPDDMRNSQVPLPQQASAAATATTKPRPKERLYESMDDMEDTYESVPDNLKPDSPVPMSPATPNTSPSKAPLLNLSPSVSPPMPPSSPVPKTTAKEPEKKLLEKTLSAAQSEQEGDSRRRFSFFGRKKTASVSGIGSKKERDKHKDQKGHKDHKDHKDTKDHKEHHHMPHQPLPDVPSHPPAMSPPLPPIPNQDDDEDTTYDTPQLDFMAGPAGQSPLPSPMSPMSPPGLLEAKAKSQSLPSSARGAGASMFHSRANVPLPRVPEDSGQGLVIRERVLESPVGGEEEEKPYDSVKVLPGGEKPYDTVEVLDEGENMDEPNYDTVHPEDIFRVLHEDENNEADPGYDRVKQLREEEGNLEGGGGGEEEGAAAPKEGQGAGIRYGKVMRPTSPEDDKVGIVPEHDEEGYAVVPEDFKMRKRALSASKGVVPKVKHEISEAGYNSINEVEEVTTASTDEPVEPSEPYATVDILAKKEPVEPSEPYATVDIIAKKEKKTDTLTSKQESALRQRSVSPVPPPLPPVGDLGDIEEFSQPPIPIQSEGIHELVPADDERGRPSSSLEPPGSDDPPYAKVKSKDHAYAELDLGAVREMAKLVILDDTNKTEATYDEVDAKTAKSAAALKDKALGYDTVADSGTLKEEGEEALGFHTVSSTNSDKKTQREQSSGYDTVIDSDGGRGENGASTRSQVELETPKLEPAEPQQLYDSLEPLAKKDEGGKEEEPTGNLYYTLEAEQVQNGVSPEDVEEEQYEEIDEDRRMQLIEKQKQSSQGKLS